MTTREQAIRLCLEQPGSYEDYPFGPEWAIIRHRAGNKMFAAIFERQGRVWLNLKAAPEWGEFWRRVYPSVVPAFHISVDGGSGEKERAQSIKRLGPQSVEKLSPEAGPAGQ